MTALVPRIRRERQTMADPAGRQDEPAGRSEPGRRGDDGWFAWGLMALGLALAVNTLLGPLATDTIGYPFSETLRNQTVGLEAVSLLLVAPLCVAAGILSRRGHPAGQVLALGPTAYTAYMFVQYIIGPGYVRYPRVLPFHVGLFILSVVVGLKAWTIVDEDALPAMSPSLARRRSKIVVALGAFVVLRYLPALVGAWTNEPIAREFTREPAMFWSILALDLGLVVPGAVAVAVNLYRSRSPSKGLYALVGWFALVPPSVTAMSVVMLANDDPSGSIGQVLVFGGATLAFWTFAFCLFRPLLSDRTRPR